MIKMRHLLPVSLLILAVTVSIISNSYFRIGTAEIIGEGSHPQVSPNGRSLLTSRGEIIPIDNSEVLDISGQLNNFLTPQWLSSTEIVYAHRLDNQSGIGLYQFHVLDVETLQTNSISPTFDKQLSTDNFFISPNKVDVAFWRLKDGTRQLSVLDLSENSITNYDQPLDHVCYYMAWLSESMLLLYCLNEKTQTKDLWLLDRSNGDLTLSLENHSYRSVFSVSPVNESLAMLEPQQGIVLVQLQNGIPAWNKKQSILVKGQSWWLQQISFQNKGVATHISWLPDGSGLVFDEGLESRIWLIKFDK